MSVVVPAFNASATIATCLKALLAQRFSKPDYEIIVVDDGSTDDTFAVASGLGVRVVRQPNAGAGAARNAGWRAASGVWVAFTDADCAPARSWLATLVGTCERRAAVGAAGKTLGLGSRSAAAKFCDLDGALDAERHLAHPQFPFAPSGNLIYLRSALERVGGFDERYSSYEACDLHQRIMRAHEPMPFCYEPGALVLHRHREGWKAFWRQQYSYGRGYGQFMFHHSSECRWTLGHELRAWGQIGTLGLGAWLPPRDDAALHRRGLFVKKFAQHLGFLRTRLDARERAKW
ncbi:MAG TPA: glycosyltransferase [Candidatus Acidoferrales bacterium]|nr:glycosyltransferase [Candidatus Acidoferrales bacterium]